jgi:uncharacterized protein (DUF433 family)
VPLDDSILGQGVYTPREAARLVGRTPQQVLRWTRGSGTDEPLWHAHYQFLEDSTEISFLDLVEVRVVASMRSAGISMQAIRFAMRLAQEKYGIERPLASQNFKTDGRSILMDAIEEDGEYVSLSSKYPGQKVFKDIVDQSLNDLEYEEDLAARWRPADYQAVVIDPKRFFGDPLLDEFGVSTHTIYTEFNEFDDFRYLASIYEIPIQAIKQAVAFERSLSAAQKETDGQNTV